MSPSASRRLHRALATLLRLGVDELTAGNATRIEGHGWTATRFPSQGSGKPESDVIRLELRVGTGFKDRFDHDPQRSKP